MIGWTAVIKHRAQLDKHTDRLCFTHDQTLLYPFLSTPSLFLPASHFSACRLMGLHPFQSRVPLVYNLISYKVQIDLLGSGTCHFLIAHRLVWVVRFISCHSPCLFWPISISVYFFWFLPFPLVSQLTRSPIRYLAGINILSPSHTLITMADPVWFLSLLPSSFVDRVCAPVCFYVWLPPFLILPCCTEKGPWPCSVILELTITLSPLFLLKILTIIFKFKCCLI